MGYHLKQKSEVEEITKLDFHNACFILVALDEQSF